MANLPTGDIPPLSTAMRNTTLSPTPSAAASIPTPAASPFPIPLPPRDPPKKKSFTSSNGYHNEKQDHQTATPPPAAVQAYQPPPPAYDATVLCTVTAQYDYAGPDAGDLPLTTGETINVTEYVNGDWWKGTSLSTGKSGIFPRAYVKEVEKGKEGYGYGNVPLQVSNGEGSQVQQQGSGPGAAGKGGEMGKKFGKKLGNAAIFGAGATIGSNIVNGIF